MKKMVHTLVVWLFCPATFFAQSVTLTEVVNAGITGPIGAYFAPGNDTVMYVLQQNGRIKLANVNTGAALGTDFLNISSKITTSGNEQGLLGLAFHPNYASNGYFYINYTKSGGGATVIARYKRNSVNPLMADVASESIVMQVAQPYSNHNGGQLQFGRDGYLYIGLGDGGSGGDPNGNGQNGLVRLAKMMRVDVDVDSGYAIPATNPYVSDNTKLPEIWDIGLRNPWRYSFDLVTADLWIADVGQELWEEIDFEPANSGGAKNYGWRCYEGNATYNTTGCGSVSNYTAPAYVYSSGSGSGNCSVTGGFVYRGGSYADFYGKYIFTDYCSGKFWFMQPDGAGGWTTNQVSTTPLLTYQIVSFAQDGKGEMYVVSREGNKIYKLTGDVCAPADIYSSTGSFISCGTSLQLNAPYGANNTYAWYRNDTLLSGTSSTINATISGLYKVVVENAGNSCGGTDTATVIVNAASTQVTWTTPITMEPYCLDEQIPLSASPAGGTFSGPGVVGNTFFAATAGVGNHTLTYTYVNGNGCSSSANSPNLVVANCYSSIAENTSISFSVFPNPFVDEIQIPLDGQKNITVSTVDGKIVLQRKQTSNTIALGFLSAGTYMLQVEQNGKWYRHTLIKTNR